MKNKEYILSLGSNIKLPEKQISLATYQLEKNGIKVNGSSAFYVSESVGYTSDNLFINQSLLIETALEPMELLSKVKYIETSLGRTYHKKGYEDRVIDIDLILFEENFENESLCIPHKEWKNRKFVAYPTFELRPKRISFQRFSLDKEKQNIIRYL